MCDSKVETVTPVNMSSILTPSVAQYLHPDYLQPLPTTLDAKKSPLALLAQTCSSIGKDPLPSKSIIPPLEKKEGEKSIEKPGSVESRKSPVSKESGRDSANKPGFRSIPPKEIPPLVPISSHSPSSKGSSTPEPKKSDKLGETSVASSVTRPVSSTGTSHTTSVSSTRSTSSAPIERDSDRERERERDRTRDSGSEGKLPSRCSPEHHISKPSLSHPHLGLAYFGTNSIPHPGLSMYGHSLGLDPAAAASSAYASSLAAAAAHSGYNLSASAAAALAAQNAALKPGLSPYVSYARVRTPSGATTLVPVCRDPYCTNCQLTLQNSHTSTTCTAPGCAQCAHEKSLQSLSALGMAGASSLSMLPQSSSLASVPSGLSAYPGLTSSLYAQSLLNSASGQGMPFVCNWVAGSDYCGKRFSTSEELLQHLRSHTSSVESVASLAGYASLGLPPPFGLSGYPGHIPPAHGGLSPNSLRRAYPTIPSPLSSVISGSRYHPYKSSLTGVPSALPPGQSLSSIGPYYSPYSLYGQRIGAAAVP